MTPYTKTRPLTIWLLPLSLTLCLTMCVTALAQSSSFTYQGRLTDSSNPADGLFDMQFKLFDTATVGTGTQQGATITNSSVQVTNGTFTVELDFGAAVFDGSARFLEISIRPTGSAGANTVLGPRQALTATPYAVRSAVAANALQFGGQPASGFIQNTTTQQVATNFNISGNGTVAGTLTGGVVNATTQYNINGLRMLVANGPFNNGFGTILAASNTFLGNGAGQSTTPSGTLASSSGKFNTFVGANAGKANTTGNRNSFFGLSAGEANTSGDSNSFFGMGAGASNNIGFSNSFFGSSAGLNNTNGSLNSFFGWRAGAANFQGDNNSFFGLQAGGSNTNGSNNSFFGFTAGETNTIGSGNTIIGNSADVGADNLTNASAIGSGARVDQSNSLVLGGVTGISGTSVNVGIGTTAPTFKLHVVDAGNTGVRVQTNTAGGNLASFGALGLFDIDAVNVPGGRVRVLEDGKVGIGDASPADRLQVFGDIRVGTSGTNGCLKNFGGGGIIGTCSSDLRLKHTITPFPATLDKLVKLRPVHFYWRAKEYPEKRFGHEQSFGLIAQEVEEVMPELVSTDEQGFKAINYSKLPVLTVQAVKELKAENDTLKAKLQQQQAQIEMLKKAVCQMNPNAGFCK